MSSARQVVRAAVRRLESLIGPLSGRATILRVRQARTAARKVGDTLSTFDLKLPALKKQTGRLKDAFGAVRDLHVSGQRRGAELNRALFSMRVAIAAWMRARPDIQRELAHPIATPSPKKRLRQRLRKLDHRIEELPARLPPRKAHQLRLKAKRARTAVGLVAPEKKNLLNDLKKASTVLGALHDLDAGLATRGPTRKQLVHQARPVLEKLRSSIRR